MAVIRIYICKDCGRKFWPNKEWNRICDQCGGQVTMSIFEE